jgi:hypothetical protein
MRTLKIVFWVQDAETGALLQDGQRDALSPPRLYFPLELPDPPDRRDLCDRIEAVSVLIRKAIEMKLIRAQVITRLEDHLKAEISARFGKDAVRSAPAAQSRT